MFVGLIAAGRALRPCRQGAEIDPRMSLLLGAIASSRRTCIFDPHRWELPYSKPTLTAGSSLYPRFWLRLQVRLPARCSRIQQQAAGPHRPGRASSFFGGAPVNRINAARSRWDQRTPEFGDAGPPKRHTHAAGVRLHVHGQAVDVACGWGWRLKARVAEHAPPSCPVSLRAHRPRRRR